MALVFPDLTLAEPTRWPGLETVLRELVPEHPAVAQWRRERNTFHAWVEPEPGAPRVFVKIYRPPLVRNAFTPVARSRARREYDNSRAAHERGLPVVPAIAFGERRVNGFVVDQMVAFEDLGDVKSLAQILLWSGTPETRRAEGRAQFARTLSLLHDGGYLHLAASPRNLLRVRRSDGATEWLWIDHPSGVLVDASIRAREVALADVLSAFESAALVPDDDAARAFLAVYAPDATGFAERALALRRNGARAAAFCARAKWRDLWRRPAHKSRGEPGRKTST